MLTSQRAQTVASQVKPRPLPVEIHVIREAYVAPLAELQRLAYPTLTPEELFSAEDYHTQLRVFPDAQFAAIRPMLDGSFKVVGSCSALRISMEKAMKPHTFAEIIGDGDISKTHEPDGEWLYGIDMAVHPDYRRRGVSKRLYQARSFVVRRLNLRGEVAGGMLPGYERFKKRYSIEDYVARVVKGELTDPTLSVQLAMGFEVRGILYDHITDPRSNNCATLIVRPNPEYMDHGDDVYA